MRLSVYLCMCPLVFSFSSGASAQQPLSEAEAVERVSLESPRARAIRAQVDLARADVAAARRFPNPRVTVSREAVAGVAEDFLLFAQTLPVTGRRGLQVSSAAAAVQASELRAGDLERRLRADARGAFVELSAQATREQELVAVLDDLKSLATVLARREQAGDAAGFDRLRAEREALDIEAELSDARALRARAQGVLASYFFPTPDPSTLRAAPLAIDRRALPPAPELVAHAETARPDLLAFERDIEAARFAARGAARSVVPEPEIVAGLKTSDVGAGDRGGVLSLLANIPLFDRAQPERLRAVARELLATAERDALRAEIGATVLALRSAVEQRRASADAYRREALPRAADLRRIAQVSYDAGERGILELLDAYRSASNARLRLVDLETDVARSEIDLEVATAVEIRK
jgi:outer membrane protein, heavy metal efflux system